MTFRCPNHECGSAVGLGDARCRHCGQPLGFLSILLLILRRWWEWLKGAILTRCPQCRAIIPLREVICPCCGNPVTMTGAVHASVKPTRSAVGRWLRGLSPEAKRGLRWSYVVASALLFWMLVLRVEKRWTNDWFDYSMIGVVYLAFLYLFFLWVVPRKLRAAAARRIRMATKVAAIFNFFSFLLLLLLFIANYWGEANKIALLFGITFAGFWIFSNLLRNLWFELAFDWTDIPHQFDHLGNQGRTAYRD